MSKTTDALSAAWELNGKRWEKISRKVRAQGIDVWNPGLYAGDLHRTFLKRFPAKKGALLVLGLNPGPAGMAQTGIPFTDVRTARDRLGFIDMEIPGAAPKSLIPRLKKPTGKWKLTYERSSLGIYAALEACWGDLKSAYANWFVGNPCPLLFLERGGWNVTPADKRLRSVPGMHRMREEAVEDFVAALKPRGILFLGKDVEKATHDISAKLVGEDKLIPYPHPARAVPKKWAAELRDTLAERGML